MLAGLVQAPTSLDPDRPSGRRPLAAAARCCRRWSSTHKITKAPGQRGQRGAAADQDLLSGELAAQLLHRRLDRPADQPGSAQPGRPRQRARQDQGRRAPEALRGRAADLHELRSDDGVRRQPRDRQHDPQGSDRVHRPRSSRSTTPTARCARSRSVAVTSASQFDPAVDGPGRQAGSSFKGITLATALSAGLLARGPRERERPFVADRARQVLQPVGRLRRRRPHAHRGDRPFRQLRVRAHGAVVGARSLRQRRRRAGRGDGAADGDRHVALRRSARRSPRRSGPTASTRSRWPRPIR